MQRHYFCYIALREGILYIYIYVYMYSTLLLYVCALYVRVFQERMSQLRQTEAEVDVLRQEVSAHK